MKNLIIIFVLCTITISANGQLFETRQLIDVTGGVSMMNASENNMFFPSSEKQSGINVQANYGYKINSWFEGGVSFGYLILSKPDENIGFAEVVSSGGSIFSVGPQVVVHSPFSEIGVFNRFRLGLAFSPQFHLYSGERSLLIDNEVLPVSSGSSDPVVIEMNKNSSSFGFKLSPEINGRITQRVGLKIAYALQNFNIDSGFNNEKMFSHSFQFGLIFTFGNYKNLF